jgi:predicted dehydrogenase
MGKKRFVQVGLGGRHEMFRDAITRDYAKKNEMVALCDINVGRLKLSAGRIQENTGFEVKQYLSKDFDKMIKETKPDCVIVTTKDCHHDDYVCKAMEAGCDVITEKPMTIDGKKCRRILDTQKKTGRKCTVTFNYRYSPPRTQLKDLLLSGVIGDVLSVDFHWMLDTHHGADYFRRWHRNKRNSGGLMVHKATHHFDLVNWLLGTVPEKVYASGHRRFYTPEMADQYGLKKRGERCHGCKEAARCPFSLQLKDNDSLRKMYLETESYDGYFRDQCVFSPKINIEDSMNLVVDYRNRAKMSYSLNAFSPWEGHTITFNGTRGRLEHKCEESVYINADGTVPGALKKEGTWTRIYPLRAAAYSVKLWNAKGGHGGADPVMLQQIFAPETLPPDKYLRAADQRAGAWSILVGVAANRSMAENRPVAINELVPHIDLPDYPVASKPEKEAHCDRKK